VVAAAAAVATPVYEVQEEIKAGQEVLCIKIRIKVSWTTML